MISIAERKRRHKQLAYAMGSCEMEGCIFTDETKNFMNDMLVENYL